MEEWRRGKHNRPVGRWHMDKWNWVSVKSFNTHTPRTYESHISHNWYTPYCINNPIIILPRVTSSYICTIYGLFHCRMENFSKTSSIYFLTLVNLFRCSSLHLHHNPSIVFSEEPQRLYFHITAYKFEIMKRLHRMWPSRPAFDLQICSVAL